MSDDRDLLHLTRRLRLERHETFQPVRWRPAADIYRHRSGWLIKVELAGVRPDQIDVLTHGGCLIVRGRRRDVTLHDGYASYAMEIVYSEFERVLQLPVDLDCAELVTNYRDGMLLVTIITESEQP